MVLTSGRGVSVNRPAGSHKQMVKGRMIALHMHITYTLRCDQPSHPGIIYESTGSHGDCIGQLLRAHCS